MGCANMFTPAVRSFPETPRPPNFNVDGKIPESCLRNIFRSDLLHACLMRAARMTTLNTGVPGAVGESACHIFQALRIGLRNLFRQLSSGPPSTGHLTQCWSCWRGLTTQTARFGNGCLHHKIRSLISHRKHLVVWRRPRKACVKCARLCTVRRRLDADTTGNIAGEQRSADGGGRAATEGASNSAAYTRAGMTAGVSG